MTQRLVAFCLLLSVPALAQTEEVQKKKGVPVQRLDFLDASTVEACQLRPDLLTYEVPKRPGGFKSLIKVRMNFNDKLLESEQAL